MSFKRSPKVSPIKVRKSPNTHARYHKVGAKVIGLDGNMWKIIYVTKKDGTKYKRWAKV